MGNGGLTNTQPQIDEQGTAEIGRTEIDKRGTAEIRCTDKQATVLRCTDKPAATLRTWELCGSLFVNLRLRAVHSSFIIRQCSFPR